MFDKISDNKLLTAIITSILVFVVYLITMAKGIIQLDSGELASVASTLGIAHPTGYPLFTILGYVFTKILFFVRPVYALNIMAGIFTASSIYFLILIIDLILSKVYSDKKTFISSIVSAVIIAFSKTYWFQSTSVEVYSLHLLLLSATIYFYLLATQSINYRFITQKNWIVFSVLFALCFTNHLTSVLLIPAFLFLFFNSYGFKKEPFINAILLLIPFLVTLIAVYAYLPIRASQNPEINWGNPIDYERLVRHVMGWQYQSWIFSSMESAGKQFSYFIKNFFPEFGYFAGLLMFSGIYFIFSTTKKYFYFTSILFLSCVFYSINYDISDIDAYFLLTYFSSGVFIAFTIFNMFQNNKLKYLMPIVVFSTLFFNFNKVNQSKNKQFEQYTYHFLHSVEPNAIVIGYTWDFLFSPAYYIQFVENYRKDVIMIDKELLRRSWYYNQLKTTYPDFYKTIEKEVNLFLPELAKFERKEKNYDGNLLDKLYKDIISKIINSNIDQRPVYLCFEMVKNEIGSGEIKLANNLTITPDYFAYRIRKSNEYLPIKITEYKIDYLTDDSYYTNQIKKFNSALHAERAYYEFQFKNVENARFFKNKAINANSKISLPDYLSNL